MVSVSIELANPARTLVRFSLIGEWTWEEYARAREEFRKVYDRGAGRVDLIVDLSTSVTVPINALSHTRQALSHAHPRLGDVVIVGDDYLRVLLTVFQKMHPGLGGRMAYAPSLDEARQRLATGGE